MNKPSPSHYKPLPSPLTATDYADLFVAAVEGGINYWAATNEYRHQFATHRTPDLDAIDDFVTATIIDEETQDAYKVDSRSEVWHDAVDKAAAFFDSNLVDFFEDHDAGSGDVAMQYALFGEVIYG